jgi:hypothetical protein
LRLNAASLLPLSASSGSYLTGLVLGAMEA